MESLYRKTDLDRQSGVANDRDYRSGFRRDYARLLHSPAFRRLQGKTQLFPEFESDFFRNRLTHSLEVAQIAKTTANKINGSHEYFQKQHIDADLVEFAALAHDLGHPPFGHHGEKALDECMCEVGGFEGNAQTLRIVARIEKKDIEGGVPPAVSKEGRDLRLGLNPTFRTLASVLKYDQPIPAKRPKGSSVAKGYYDSEAALVQRIKEGVVGKSDWKDFKTIECSIMDLADDIAYSTYDIEDTLKSGLLNPLSIVATIEDDLPLQEKLVGEVKKGVAKSGLGYQEVTREDVFDALAKVFGGIVTAGKSPQESFLESRQLAEDGYVRTEFTSRLVRSTVDNIRVKFNEQTPSMSRVYLDRPDLIRVETLKQIAFLMIIRSNLMRVAEYRGFEIIEALFKILSNEKKGGPTLLPSDVLWLYQAFRQPAEKQRVICDFIACMTDSYALDYYNRLTGDTNTIFKPL